MHFCTVTPMQSQFSSEMTCSYSLGILLINNALTNSSQLNPSIFTITVSGITNPIPATTYGSFLIRIRQLDNTIAE